MKLQIALHFLSKALHVTYKLVNIPYFTNEEMKIREALKTIIVKFFC